MAVVNAAPPGPEETLKKKPLEKAAFLPAIDRPHTDRARGDGRT
jgi:hypothetical protein